MVHHAMTITVNTPQDVQTLNVDEDAFELLFGTNNSTDRVLDWLTILMTLVVQVKGDMSGPEAQAYIEEKTERIQ